MLCSSFSRMTQTYRLSIFDATHNQMHEINFPGTKTVLEVKRDISDLTNIPVRHQLWSGWPSQITDDVSCIFSLFIVSLFGYFNFPFF